MERTNLADENYYLLMSALQTRNVPIIAHTLLGIEQLAYQVHDILGASHYYNSTNKQSNVREGKDLQRPYKQYQQFTMEDGEISNLPKIEAIDLSMTNTYAKNSTRHYGRSVKNTDYGLGILKTISPMTKEYIHQQLKSSENPPQLFPLNLVISGRSDDECRSQPSFDDISSRSSLSNRSSFSAKSDLMMVAVEEDDAGVKDGGRSGRIFPSRRPMECDICSKIVRADNFQVHMRSHTGEKPYKCPICPFRSANPSSMPKHLRLHDSGREIFKCPKCSYSTIYKSNLSAHKRNHHHHDPKLTNIVQRPTQNISPSST